MFGLTRRNQDISTYNPWREMEEFEKAFFGRPFGSFFDTPAFAQVRTDVTDEGDHYLLEADLPGFEKKDITLDIQNDTLIVRADRPPAGSGRPRPSHQCGTGQMQACQKSYQRVFRKRLFRIPPSPARG